MWALTIRFAVGDQVLQHLVHGSHEEDEPELGHRHGDETPQEDGRADGVREGNSAWTTGGRARNIRMYTKLCYRREHD